MESKVFCDTVVEYVAKNITLTGQSISFEYRPKRKSYHEFVVFDSSKVVGIMGVKSKKEEGVYFKEGTVYVLEENELIQTLPNVKDVLNLDEGFCQVDFENKKGKALTFVVSPENLSVSSIIKAEPSNRGRKKKEDGKKTKKDKKKKKT